VTQRLIIEAFAENLEEMRRVAVDEAMSQRFADVFTRHVSRATQVLEVLSSLQERVTLASHQLFGKSAEKRLPTSTEAQAVFSALFLDLVVPNPVTPTEPLAPEVTRRTEDDDGLVPCGELSSRESELPCVDTCQVVTLACLVDDVSSPSSCSDSSQRCIDANDQSDRPGSRPWQGDWLLRPEYTDMIVSKLSPSACPHCDAASYRRLPPVERRVVVLVREHLRVKLVVRERGVCIGGCSSFYLAPWPMEVEEPLIERGLATPSAIARVLVDHAAYGMAVYTQQERLSESGLRVPYKALLRWRNQGLETLRILYPLLGAMSSKVDTLIVDDTGFMALDLKEKTGDKKTIAGHMWGKTDNETFVYFAYARDWKASFLETFLQGFAGVLVGDGYAGYKRFFSEHELAGLAGCSDHARRKFVDASKLRDAHARDIIELFAKLYEVERAAKRQKLDAAGTRAMRQQLAKPIFQQLGDYLRNVHSQYSPRSTMHRAITYFLRNEATLSHYLDNGNVPNSTAALERMIRAVAKIRKNSLFVGSAEGGDLLAINISFMLSCRLVGVSYFDYLVDVLPKLAGTSFPASRLAELLPHRWAELHRGAAKTAA